MKNPTQAGRDAEEGGAAARVSTPPSFGEKSYLSHCSWGMAHPNHTPDTPNAQAAVAP